METLRPLWVPLAAAAVALIVLLVDSLAAPATRSRNAASQVRGRVLGWLSAGLLTAIFLATFLVDVSGTTVGGVGVYVGNAWSLLLQRILLGAGLLGVLGAIDDVARKTPHRQSEYWMLLLLSLSGMLLLPGARDLILLVVSFELMGIPLYVLAAFAKTDAASSATSGSDVKAAGRRAAEAGLKLYLTGATSTAITFFGLALLVGMTGTTRLVELAAAPVTPLSAVGMLLVLGGLGFKIGMVPFHMWIPDTYEGAATPFVAFLSVAPKAAGVAALASIFVLGLGAAHATWLPPLSLLAFLTMAIGNLMALPQTDLRRLLAYSGIAQMGYVLVAIVGADAYSVGMALFFLAAYVVTNAGAFLVVHAVADRPAVSGGRPADSSADSSAAYSAAYSIDGLAGLAKRAPLLSIALLMFLLSLAGIPFAVGFWAKLYVFLAAWRAGRELLVVAAVVLAAVGLFYYLRLARAAYMLEPPSSATGAESTKPRAGLPLRLAIALCLIAVLGMGLYPRPFVESALEAGAALVGGAK